MNPGDKVILPKGFGYFENEYSTFRRTTEDIVCTVVLLRKPKIYLKLPDDTGIFTAWDVPILIKE